MAEEYKPLKHAHSHHGHHGHHSHAHHHGHSHARNPSAKNNIAFTFLLNLAFVAIEIIGGYFTGSVAILADALHDLGDCLSLLLAWILEHYSAKSRTSEFSYGYGRLSLLAAVISGVIISIGSFVILYAAIPRLYNPEPSHGLGMLLLACLGIAVNGWAAVKLARGKTMNERVLLWHYIEDILGWVAVFVGAIFIAWKGWTWIDPLLAIGIALFVLWNVFRNLQATVKLFLQSVPEDFDEPKFLEQVKQISGITEVHDLHIWSIDGNQHILSLHVGIRSREVDHGEIKRRVREIAKQMGDYHTTIEIEDAAEPCSDKC